MFDILTFLGYTLGIFTAGVIFANANRGNK